MRLASFERKDRPGRRLGALLATGDLVDLNRALALCFEEADAGAPEVEADSALPREPIAFLGRGAPAWAAAERALAFVRERSEPAGRPWAVRAGRGRAGRGREPARGDSLLRRRGALVAREAVRLEAPVPRPGKILGVARNYPAHARERGQGRPPEEPVLFLKAPSAVIGPEGEVVLPTASRQVDFEGELACVIGTRAKAVPESAALEHVAGYTIANDVSARDYQGVRGQRFIGKSCDTFAPLGPVLVTRDEIPDPQDLEIRTVLSGETVQSARTKEMIFPVAAIVAFASRLMTLEPGDVILTGTPAGVGAARRPPRFLRDGDLVEVHVSGIGRLRSFVRGQGH